MTITAIQHSTIQIAPSYSVNDASFASRNAVDRKLTVDLLSHDYNNSDRNRGQRAKETSLKEIRVCGKFPQILIF